MFEILGVIGIAISVAAYVPQVIHLEARLVLARAGQKLRKLNVPETS